MKCWSEQNIVLLGSDVFHDRRLRPWLFVGSSSVGLGFLLVCLDCRYVTWLGVSSSMRSLMTAYIINGGSSILQKCSLCKEKGTAATKPCPSKLHNVYVEAICQR